MGLECLPEVEPPPGPASLPGGTERPTTELELVGIDVVGTDAEGSSHRRSVDELSAGSVPVLLVEQFNDTTGDGFDELLGGHA